MNERIRQLAEQAGHRYIPSSNSGPLRVEYLTPELEKFAELIVQDCIDIISPYTVRMSRPGEEYLHPILEIKKHFGVKE